MSICSKNYQSKNLFIIFFLLSIQLCTFYLQSGDSKSTASHDTYSPLPAGIREEPDHKGKQSVPYMYRTNVEISAPSPNLAHIRVQPNTDHYQHPTDIHTLFGFFSISCIIIYIRLCVVSSDVRQVSVHVLRQALGGKSLHSQQRLMSGLHWT